MANEWFRTHKIVEKTGIVNSDIWHGEIMQEAGNGRFRLTYSNHGGKERYKYFETKDEAVEYANYAIGNFCQPLINNDLFIVEVK